MTFAAERAFQICFAGWCWPALAPSPITPASFPLGSFTVGVRPLVATALLCIIHCSLTRSHLPPSPPHRPTFARRHAHGSPAHTTHISRLTPCPAYNRTSLSMMTKRSAAPFVSRSSTCPTGTSGHAPAATRCAPLKNSVSLIGRQLTRPARYANSATTTSRPI